MHMLYKLNMKLLLSLFQSAVVDAKRLPKRLATNLERQLAFPARPTLFELSKVS